MATKLFKSITIDGETYKLDDDLGRAAFVTALKNIPTANTDVIGATQTITEPGTYFFLATWTFPSASTTGNRISSLCVGFKANGATTFTKNNRMTEGSPGNNDIHMMAPWVTVIDASVLPFEVAAIANSTAATTTQDYSGLLAAKLIKTMP